MTDPADLIAQALADGEPIGWQVLDADGNVVSSGPVVIAEMTSDLAESLGLDPAQEG